MHSRFKKSLQIFLIFIISVGWIFSGWPLRVSFAEVATSTPPEQIATTTPEIISEPAIETATTTATTTEEIIEPTSESPQTGEVLGAITAPEMAFIVSNASSGATLVSSVSINVSAIELNDLIYDGSIGSVGLTLEPLLTMRWWGIAVYTETDSFVSECVSIASPLPAVVFNIDAGDYKTSLSLAETKADCETFNQNEYPLFVVLEAANFSVK